MSNQGDDCYFYFYSTCSKGDSCSFRHCEAALGTETVCRRWQEGRCFRNTCRFRHMEMDKKRSEMPCYWENQPAGCQKSNCAFHHTKGRYVDGLFLPPGKTTLPSPPESAEDDVKMAQMSLQQNKFAVQSNPSPQLGGVRKVEYSKNVPSPTHPPVVINAAEDDENLNFGVKTVEEIKLKKRKQKPKKKGEGPSGVSVHPLQSRTIPVPEKENVRSVVRTVTLSTKQGEEPVIQLNLAERVGKRKASTAGKSVLPLKRNLAERLGKKVEVLENADKAPKRVQVPRSLKERLGLPSERTSTETEKAAKPAGEIHVKTLEEIRLERANRRRGEPQAKAQTEGRCKTEDPSSGARPSPAVRIKTSSGSRAEREPAPTRRRLLWIPKLLAPEREEKMIVELSKPSPRAVTAPAEPFCQSATNSKVQVKSLEEIMWEKRQLKQRQEEKLQKEAAAVPSPKTLASGRPESTVVPGSAYQLPKGIWVNSLEAGLESPGKGAAVSPGKQAAPLLEWKAETKPKVCLKPLDGKATSPTKQTLKRKAAESHPSAVAAVKPLSSTGGDTKEPSAKKAAVAVVPALPEDSLVSIAGREKPQTSPELRIGSQADSVAQSEVSNSTSASSQVLVKTRRLSSTGAGKAALSVEDDFEKLIWEISGGKLEAEIDLDPGKDEDDLLMELSEMIDS